MKGMPLRVALKEERLGTGNEPSPPPPCFLPQVRSEADVDRVGKHLQGDMSMYTNDALKKRLSLRRDPGIAAAIHRWWGATPKSNRLVVAKELERVDRFGYFALNVNIQVGPIQVGSPVH